jgi:biotin carboxyl carrier protein
LPCRTAFRRSGRLPVPALPGLILKVLSSEGGEVKKGGAVLVLEAMKMENIIKAPHDGILKEIKVVPGDKVEKNQVLIVFE